MAEDKVTNLYNAFVKNGYAMEPEAQFRENLKDPKKRKAAYDALVADGYNMEPFADFESNIGFGAPTPAPAPTAPTPQQQAQPAATAAPTSVPASATAEEQEQAPVQSQPEQAAWQPSEQEKIRMSYQIHTMLNDFNQRSRERIAQVQRMTEPLTAEGRKKRAAKKFQAQLAGTKTTAGLGLNVPSGQIYDGGSPQPYGVEYVDGKPVTQWLMPDGSLTTSQFAADRAEDTARKNRLRHQFENRMKQNGLDPAKPEDVEMQAQYDAQAPAYDAVAELWQEAEEKHKADKERNADREWSNYAAMGGGREMRIVTTAANRHADNISHMTRFDLQKMMDNAWARAGSKVTANCYNRLRQQYPDASEEELQTTASQMARQLTDNAVYQYAVQQNTPKSTLEYFGRTVADMNVINSISKGLARSQAGTSGDLAAYEAAMGEYGKNHRVAQIAGTVTGMAVDPVTWVSGGVGSLAGKGAINIGGRIVAGRAATSMSTQLGSRIFSSSLTGRIITGAAAGGGNFATYEMLKEGESQFLHGGHINSETGENEGYSAGAMLSAGGHGLVLGSVTGTLSPMIGNVADKTVKATTSTAAKAGVRLGEVAVSTLAEGTIFSVPEWINGDSDAMDVWTDNMAMMLGFKVSHGVKSAPRVIASLRPVKPVGGRPLTQAERNHNRMDFEERLRRNLDASPSDLSFTSDEREELRRAGYGELADLFSRDRVQEVQRPDIDPAEGAIELRAERVEAETISRNPEFDGYSSMEELMQDGRVSQSARAKAYYILTGRRLPMASVTGYTTNKDADGRVTVNSIAANGEVVTSRTFKNEQEAKQETDNIMRQAELNSVDVGERYKEAVADDMVLDAAISEVSPGADPATIKKIYRAVKAGNKDVTESQVQLVEFLDDAIGRNKEIADKYRPEAIRAELMNETGIDVDVVLRKMPGKRTEVEQAAVKSYLERLFPEEARQQNADPTLEQAEAQNRYEQGRLLYGRFEEGDPTVQADVDAIALRMQEAYQAVEDAFGAEAEYYMFHVNENPWALVNDPELTAEQQDAVLYYINAKAALDGVMDASNEVADRKRAEVEQSVGKRTHKDNGIIIPATMKVDDRQVYVVKGDVVMFPDGSAVDVRNSSESVVVMDAQTGEYEFTSPDQIFKVSEAVNPQDELDTALSVIEQEQMSVFGQNAIAPEEPAEGEAPIDQSADVSPEPAPETASTEEYDRGYEQGLEEAAKADDAWVANLIKIYSQNTPESMPETMKGRLDAFLYEQQRRAQSVPEMPENVPNPTENSVSDAEIAPETVSSVENGQQTALSRIPLNEQGEPRFEAVDKDTAWDGLVEAVGGETDAVDIAMAQVQQASTDLEALKKKPPTLKAPKLKGSPMAMAQAKREAAEQYQRDLAQYNQQIADTEARLATWNGIVGIYTSRNAELRRQQEEERRQRDAIAHDEAVARFEEEQRIKAEKQAEQERIGVHAVNPKIRERWESAPKVEGNEDALTLPDGSTISGRYILTEAGAASPSHDVNNAYAPTEGFPIDENGQSVNDRDYQRDKDAQQKVEGMAGNYDNRALQDPVIVSKDGVVLSGNNRTMSGDLAARQGTDRAYNDYLAQFGHKKYGFTPEQVASMKNPRVVFVPDEALPYDATTFARFNAQEKKSQGKPEAAVKLGKIVPYNVFTSIVNDISRYDRLSDYYADEKAIAHALGALMQAGVINDMQMPEMRTGTALSAAGKELIENTLIGKVFQTSPDAVRQIISMPTLRQSIVMGLNEIANNRTLARNGYDISEELAKAVDLVTRAKAAMPDVYTDGMPVSPFGRMQGLFDDEFGDSRVADATALLLADILNSGKPSDLRKVLTSYNNEAAQASGGQMDMFSGSIPTKEEILTTVNEHFRNATPKEQQALVDAAIAERKRRAEADAEQRERSEASEQTPNDDERSAVPQQPTADGGTELEPLAKERNDIHEDTPEEAALRARISVGDEWEEKGPAPDKPIYKRKLYVDGKHEVIQTDAPDKNGSYTGSQLTYEGRDFGDLKEIADYIDGGMQAEPTEAQKAAGNYKMEHRRVDGYNISIENAKGSVRRGTGADGKPWETTMQNDYGYIRGTEGVDGDHIDVFLSDTPEEGDVFVVDQVNEDGSFDEHKVMYGFPTEQAARDAYLSNYEPGWTGLGAITHVSKDEFKKWIQSSRRKTKPFAEYKSVKPIVGNDMIGRSLTEQEATELIARMEATAEVAPTIELTPENWIAQFGEDGTVETPIGIVKMGANQLLKLYSTKRTGYFGMIHPTLSTPDVILEEADPKEGSERDSKYLFIKTFVKSDGTRIVHFESVTVKKDGMEVSISSHEIKDKSLKNKMQNDIVLHLDEKLSPSSEMRLTEAPSESEGPDLVPTSDNVISSDRKDNTLSADKQAESAESSEPYTITPTTYTNKKGKTSDVHLVKFNRELTAEEKAALDTFVREPLAEGKKTSRGWYDRKQGGYMMRSEEAARQLGEMLGNEEAVADVQPMTAEELREAVGASRTRNPRPKKSPINRVSLEDVMTDLSTKGETKLSDHAEPVKAEQEAQHEISDDEMQWLANELRELLGIGEDEGDADIKFRDPGELTPQERQRIQSAGIRLAMGLVERDTTSFPDYATKMVGLLGDKIRPWLKSFYEGARWTPGYEKYAFTPTEQVAVFDVQNFDKKQADPIAQAAMIVEERKAATASEQAQKELIETRNKNRRENDKQREADTAALAEKAEAVAGEAEVTAQSAGTGEAGRKRILRDLKRVDDTLDEVNDQLAILGYYEAEEVDKDFNEAYGYMRNAEKKAVKDAVELAKQLVNDLGLGLDKVTGSTTANRGKRKNAVTANIAPAGGDISIRLPLNEGRELYITIGLDPSVTPGDVTYSGDNLQATRIMYRVEWPDEKGHVSFDRMGRNCWADANVTYADLLKGIQREAKEYLPSSTPAEAEETHNGYKIGDEVMWDRYGNGNWEKVKIEDFDTDGGPIFEAVKGVMSEKGDWSRVKPADGIFGEAKRVARATQEKKRSSRKKDVTLKPEQPFGDLFGGLFDNTQSLSNHEETEMGTRPGEAGRQRQQLKQDTQVGGDEPRRETERPAGEAGSGSTGMDSDADRAGSRGLHDVATQPALERLPEKERKNVHNNHVERGTEVAHKSESARIKANIAAIETMKKLEASGEAPTAADMKKLRAFSGWGGLGKAFSDWDTSRQLRQLLGDKLYDEGAEMSRNSAYFTPAYIVDAMWDIARAMGFKGGRVLEGSAGIGNVLGLMPQDLSERSYIRAVEKDPTTGKMLSLLYPDAVVDIDGFEKVKIETGTYDLVITNVPFVPGLKVADTSGDGDISKEFKTSIHDFCIAKNVRKLRDGGVGVFITTAGSMDGTGRLHKWLSNRENADIVGMFRMHNETFGGTNATSDIIVVRKRVNGVKSPNAIDCSLTTGVRTAEYDTGEKKKVKNVGEVPIIKTLSMSYNRYYVEHPEYMAGEMHFGFEKGDTSFRPESKGLYPIKEKDQSQLLSQWVEDMKQKLADTSEEPAPTVMNHRDEYVPTYDKVGNEVKTGTVVVDSQGRICVNYDGTARPLMSKLDNKNPKSADERIAQFNKNKVKGRSRVQVVQDYNAIKKALNDLLEYQKTSDSDEGLQPKLKALNRAFDSFVATYGHLHGNNGLAWLKNDVDYPSVIALETYREEGLEHKKVFGKADIFSRRVVVRPEQPKATNVRDGVTLSIRQTGSLDTRYIAEQLGMSEADVRREVIEAGLGYENPLTHSMEAAHEYLSGNVREKMQQAEVNNEDGRYTPNITALRKVVPHNIPSHFIEFSIGSSWLRPELFEQYVKERTGASVKLTYAGGMWAMDKPKWTGEQDKSFGIRSEICDKIITGTELIEAAMTNRTIRVSKQQKDGPTISDPKATSACAAKVDEIRDDFKSWLRSRMESAPELAKEIEETYNNIFNNSAPMTIPDEYIPEYFDGAARVIGGKPIKMRKHQSKAIVRGTMQSLMLAHEVGTGKTFTLITTAMEMRRLGTAKKPMIVVQNATLGQFVASAKALYPDARILSLEDKDRNAEGRKDFYAKIRYNDWDMVVIPQSVLERIPDHPDRERRFIEESIQEKMDVIEAMSKDREAGRAVAALKKDVENLRDQLNKLSDTETAEGEVTERVMVTSGSKPKKDGKRAAIAKENAKTRAEEMLNRATDDTLNFDDLGVDAILVDEAHEYKHLGFATAMQRGVKGVDPSYSKKCQGLYLKVKAVQEKSGGRNVIFATGTPISNTAAEVWTFMRYLLPREVMEGHNIWHFDDFVRNFGSIQQMLEFTTQGTYKENNRFAGYSNLPELARIWAGITDTVLTAEAGEVKSQIPELEGGQPTDLYLPQTNGLRAVLKFVRAQLKAYDEMSGQEKKENSHIPLVMYGIAKAAAIDARLVMANAPDDPHSKTNEAVRQTLRSLEDSKAYNGTVAIFADNYQRKNKGTGAVEFNLFDDIRTKLIAQGVPAEQVVIMRDGMTDKAKEKIFAKVNAGEIRVILGTTQRLGVGVNIQERLHTLMHIDAPNRPMDYWQRMGRLLRQGNMHKEMGIPVRVIRFGVEDSLDVTAYQRLKTKGAIADAIMHSKDLLANNLENRILEEEGDEFGNITAELSGSQYAMLQNQTEKELRKLQAKQDQHRQHQMYIHRAEPRLREQIEKFGNDIMRSNEILALLENNPTTITINGKTYQSREDMQKVFEAHNKAMAAKKQSVQQDEPITSTLTFDIGNVHFTLTTHVSQIAGYGGQGPLSFDVDVQHDVVSHDIDYKRSFGDIPLKRIINELVDSVTSGKEERSNREAWVNAKERNETDLAALLKDKGKPFEHGERIKELEQKLEEYTIAMQEELKEKEAKYAEMDANIEDATDITFTSEDDEDSEDTPTNGDGNKYREDDDIDYSTLSDSNPMAMEARISELSKKVHTPVRIIRSLEELNEITSHRKRNAKGWWSAKDNEVVIVLPNNVNVADVDNTFVHEVAGHKGLRAFIGEERFNEFLGEVYNHASNPIRKVIDKKTDDMVNAEADRLRVRKAQARERAGEDVNSSYYADMAEARVEAEAKREEFRKEATEEYMSELGGRIGSEGFEKMSRDELTLWGKIKAKVQSFLDKFLRGLKIAKSIRLNDKDLSYILYKSWKNLRDKQGKGGVFAEAEDVVMRRRTGYDADDVTRFRDPGLGLEETITKMKAEALQANTDNLQAKRDAMRAIGGNLNHLRQAMARQREYDITTVKSVADLARILMDANLLDDLSKYETKRILGAINNVVGKQDVSRYVQKVMDIMVDNQLRMGANTLGRLLSIRGSHVDARGIEVQGELDPDGQRIAQVVRKATSLPKDNIDIRIAEAINRMSSTDQAIADDATIEYAGLQIARQYVEDITESKAEEKALRDSIKQAKEDKDAGQMTEDAYRQYVASTEDAIRQNKIERAEAFHSLVEQVGGVLNESVERAKAWREAEKQRVEEIHHNANSDMEGRPTDEHHKDDRTQKLVNNSGVRFLLAPLATFDQMLRMFGKKNTRGEGYLWNRYMRGWVSATEKEYTGYRDALKVLDAKVSEIYGKDMKWGDLFSIDRKLPKASVRFFDGGEMKDHELTQGNLLYIYMADKMSDGRMKLRRMGITEEDIEDIKNFLDPKFIQLADWMQEEFLVDKRNEYNEVHKRMFGASMAAIENYFPLKILANARLENVDVADDTTDTALPATSTGSIIKRRRNNLALDVTGANAFSVILDHLQQMERWAAFAEFNRDLNTLLSYKRFRNQVMNMSSVYGGGKTLWNNVRNVCRMAAGAYRPPIAALDKSAVNIAKGVTAAKVSFRVFTALKQFLSMPAYISDSNPMYLAANIANPIGAWRWSMKNLPLFEKRWSSRMAGDPRLLKSDMDWKMWRSRIVEIASRVGMSPNAFVDALTVAIGSHSMYQTKLAKYKRQGYAHDVAEARAKQDATILFNQTQQSSEGAFLSTMQVDRSWLSVLFTVFRNSSMSYTRQLYDSIRNLGHRFTPGYKGLSEEFMAKQMRRDGIDPDKADRNAKQEYRRGIIRDLVRVGVFGYVLQLAWNLGAYLPYLILGEDDEEKDKMWQDVWNHSMFGSIEGLTGGDVISAAGNMWVSGEGNPQYLTKDMPLASDVLSILKKMDKDQVSAMNDVINLLVQSTVGVNPQSLTDAVVAVMDYCGDDAETSRECALLMARVLNCPQSQLDKIYFDELDASGEEASQMTPSEIAERYARYKVRRGAPLTGWAYGNEQREKLMDKYRDRSNTLAKERLTRETDKQASQNMAQWLEEFEATKDRVKEIRKVKSRDEDRYDELLNELEITPEYDRYEIIKGYKRDVDALTKEWLNATTPAQRDSCAQAIIRLKSDMVRELINTQQ
ncbi:helicase-related protein [Bacteroides acidifaciens]|uniref:helicase-related protein n=2 Tax=Bacteroides acidifaciens TaxID=85831 RepID=UPI002590CB48|nr:helicase-related protein [Bacteroides acidifaciens]